MTPPRNPHRVLSGVASVLLEDRVDTARAALASVARMADNAIAASQDGQRWVVLDNLRNMEGALARAHLALGRVHEAMLRAEEEAVKSG